MANKCVWDPSANYFQFLSFIWNSMASYFMDDQTVGLIRTDNRVDFADFILTVFLVCMVALFRFKIIPFAAKALCANLEIGTQLLNHVTFNLNQITVHSISVVMATNFVFYQPNCSYFVNASTIWQDYADGWPMSQGERIYFLAFLSYYLVETYRTLLVDERRNDFVNLLGHHVIAVLLFLMAFSTRTHRLGIMTLLTHDITSIFENSALLFQFLTPESHRGFSGSLRLLSTAGHMAFVFSWVISRLYFFPLRVIYYGCRFPRQFISLGMGLMATGLMTLLFLRNLYLTYVSYASTLGFILSYSLQFVIRGVYRRLVLKTYRVVICNDQRVSSVGAK